MHYPYHILKFISIAMLLFFSCVDQKKEKPYNIVWLVAEDLSPFYLNAYGDSRAPTPHLDRLAREGVVFTQGYSVSGVCAPSRSTLATGLYPNSFGAQNMRTLNLQPLSRELGLVDYQAVPPPEVKMVSEILRENGFYCTNNSKEDYQFFKSELAWDESGSFAHWRNRPNLSTPFFSIFNFEVTHESKMWNFKKAKYERGAYPPKRKSTATKKNNDGALVPLQVPDDLEVKVPPYLPQNEIGKNAMRRMYSNVVRMDRAVGKILQQLEEDELLDETIIVWYSDHGGPLPRHKRLLYDSGLKVPLIIRFPDGSRAGQRDDRLVSFVDFPPTLLSMAGLPPPQYMEGFAFEGKFKLKQPRDYIHAQADRFDERVDMIRAVRNKRFKYLKNFYPERPYYLPVAYRERMEVMQELLRLRNTDALDENQALWFRTTKDVEELFDTENDPHELKNLANDPAYAEVLSDLRGECERWMKAIDDKGFIDEMDLIAEFYPEGKPQLTAAVTFMIDQGKVTLNCDTEGARIGYRYGSEKAPHLGWIHYTDPIDFRENDTLEIIAHRLGFKPVVSKTFNGSILENIYLPNPHD